MASQMDEETEVVFNDESDIEKLLHELYYDPKQPTAFTSAENVYREAKLVDSKITRDIVYNWFRKQLKPPYTSLCVITFREIKL